MAQSFNTPPSLGPDTIYETWKNELEIWKLVTNVKPEKQALAVTLSLTGQAKAKALEIGAAQLNTEDGMNILLTALDTLFLQDEVDLAYTAYSDFERLRKGENMSMGDFIIEYERRYNICRKYKMEYPDSVLAFKLLDNAGLSVKERQLVLTAASDRKFSSMKSALKRIFGNSSTTTTANEIKIKEEKEELFLVKSSKHQKNHSRYQKQVQNIKLQNKEEQIHLTGMAEEQNVLFVGVCFTGLKIATASIKNKKKMKKYVAWLCLQKNTNLKMRYS